MSGQQLATVTASTVMLLAALTAASLIWFTATDPIGLAALAATGDVIVILGEVGQRLLSLLW